VRLGALIKGDPPLSEAPLACPGPWPRSAWACGCLSLCGCQSSPSFCRACRSALLAAVARPVLRSAHVVLVLRWCRAHV
jgi:hypothetical protein